MKGFLRNCLAILSHCSSPAPKGPQSTAGGKPRSGAAPGKQGCGNKPRRGGRIESILEKPAAPSGLVSTPAADRGLRAPRLPPAIFFCPFRAKAKQLHRFHKHKLVFVLAAMRCYANELRKAGLRVHYEALPGAEGDYADSLASYVRQANPDHVHLFEIEDEPFESDTLSLLQYLRVPFTIHSSPMFLTGRRDFAEYLQRHPKPFMKTFYEEQRLRLNILVDRRGNPAGGKWSYDIENRKPLPAGDLPPVPPFSAPSQSAPGSPVSCRRPASRSSRFHGELPMARHSRKGS